MCTATSSPSTITVNQLTAQIIGANTVCAGTTVTLNTNSSSDETGGVITYSNRYTIHTFTSCGTFSVPNSINLDLLFVAGGGGGGGVIYNPTLTINSGTYNILFGAGGVAGVGSNAVLATNGQNSSAIS